jgi:N,N'-diacetyllegionaminate synthase
MPDKSYFYTESAFIHQGDIEYLLRLVKASANAGANGIKFQVIGEYDGFLSIVNPHYEPFKKAMIEKHDWEKVFTLCKELNLDVIYMPCDKMAARFANNEWRHFIKYIDIHPVNFIYQPILEIIKEGGIDIILGMGGRTKKEVDEKILFFGTQIKVLMFGHQAFPTQLYQSAIAKIALLKQQYPDVQIGYADHSPWQSDWGRQLQSVAYMLGARFFEKHIGLVAGEERFDYITSSSPESIAAMVKDIQDLDEQDVEFVNLELLNASEVKYTSRQLKAVATRDMKAGEQINEHDVEYKMIESEAGLPFLSDPTGKKLLAAVKQDHPFLENEIE